MKHPTKLLNKLFAGCLTEKKIIGLFDHLHTCSSCQKLYDQYANNLRLLSGNKQSKTELDIATKLWLRKMTPLVPKEKTKWLILSPAFAATIIMLICLSIWKIQPAPPMQTYMKGGIETSRIIKTFDVYSVTTQPKEIKQLQSGDSVKYGEYLQFKYSCSNCSHKYLYIFAIDSNQQFIPYYLGANKIRIKNTKNSIIESSILITDRHSLGLMSIYAVFSQNELTADFLQTIQSKRLSKKLGFDLEEIRFKINLIN